MMPPMDVMDSGRMTMISRPVRCCRRSLATEKNPHWRTTGQYAQYAGVERIATRDPGKRQKHFMPQRFGWTDSSDPNGYVMYSVDERIQAGMITMDEGHQRFCTRQTGSLFLVGRRGCECSEGAEFRVELSWFRRRLPKMGRLRPVQTHRVVSSLSCNSMVGRYAAG